jgi:hypothetical protein
MDMLKLAIASTLPLIYVKTDDVINVEEVLEFLTNPDGSEKVTAVNVPEVIQNISDLKINAKGRVLYTSSECKTLAKLYRWAVDQEKTIVFVNTEKSPLQFDGGILVPPKELVLKYLQDMELENPEELLPAFGGMTLKDVGEVAKLTMTRDEAITVKGINTTRRGYTKLQGITQVDTEQSFYDMPDDLGKWLKNNTEFFMNPKHPSLTPRGLLFDGPPGTGKTEASKTIAGSFGIPLYRLDLGAMMGKYVGESEGNMNAALAQIDEVEPCVIIFDEVEKVFRNTSDSGVTSRLLSQLLWWLQEHKTKVFTVMTTNDVGSIPPELYREGRIDKVMRFLGIEGYAAGLNFTKGAFESVLNEMGATVSQSDYDTLAKRVKMMFNDGAAVPQTKLTQLAFAMVREAMSTTPSEEVIEEVPVAKKTVLKITSAKKVA